MGAASTLWVQPKQAADSRFCQTRVSGGAQTRQQQAADFVKRAPRAAAQRKRKRARPAERQARRWESEAKKKPHTPEGAWGV